MPGMPGMTRDDWDDYERLRMTGMTNAHIYLLRSNYPWLVRDTKVPNKKPGTTKSQDYSAKLKMSKL